MVRSIGLVTRQLWFLPVVLVGISAVSSWAFACITPFVAFAVAAGYALSARAAVLTVMAIWLVNQAAPRAPPEGLVSAHFNRSVLVALWPGVAPIAAIEQQIGGKGDLT
jgi:hypothetical protein